MFICKRVFPARSGVSMDNVLFSGKPPTAPADIFDWIKKKASVESSLGDVRFKLGPEGAQVGTKLGLLDLLVKAGFNDEYSLNGNLPLLGGSLGMKYEHTPDNNLYWLQFKRKF